MLEFRCKFCDKKLSADDDEEGERIKCTRCRKSVRVPYVEDEEDDSDIEDRGGIGWPRIVLMVWIFLILGGAIFNIIRFEASFAVTMWAIIIFMFLTAPACVICYVIERPKQRRR